MAEIDIVIDSVVSYDGLKQRAVFISLSFDFIRYLVKNRKMVDRIPDNAEVDFLETDLPVNISEAGLPAPSQGVVFKGEHIFEGVIFDG